MFLGFGIVILIMLAVISNSYVNFIIVINQVKIVTNTLKK